MQLIVVLETKNKEGSDYYYFKSILSRFYKERGTGITITPIFMDGKGNYKIVENKIVNKMKEYDGTSKVVFFFDVDSVTLKYDQYQLNIDINDYCNQKGYEVVWFNKTVEDVLLGEVISDNKTKISKKFFKENKIANVSESNLNAILLTQIISKKSNALNILDKYLPRK